MIIYMYNIDYDLKELQQDSQAKPLAIIAYLPLLRGREQ